MTLFQQVQRQVQQPQLPQLASQQHQLVVGVLTARIFTLSVPLIRSLHLISPAAQVATVVAVSTAAVAATTTAVVANTPEPILSICGLANPDIRTGRMMMLFEGLPRSFDQRESGLVANLVMESYNEITSGTNAAVTGCLDPLAREMRSISIVNQTLSLGTSLLDPNKLEVVFEAQLSCDRCSDTSPLFSEEQMENTADSNDGNRSDTKSNTDTDSDFGTVPNAATEGIVLEDNKESRQLQLSVDFSSQSFFRSLSSW